MHSVLRWDPPAPRPLRLRIRTARCCPSPNRTTRTAPCSTPAMPRRRRVSRSRRPQGAPNVLIVLVDDMGFGMPSAFGGPVRMPSAEGLAANGLRYNQFHTTAVSSPTRTALLSGRNHHMNNMGGITETATAFPGNTGQRPEQRRAAGGDAAPERLQHRLLRQEPRDRPLGGQPLRADRSLAVPFGLRQVLRLLRRRDRPVGTHDLRRV